MEILKFSIDALNVYANAVKDELLHDLFTDNIIDEKQFKELSKTKIVSNIKLNLVSIFFNKLSKKCPSVKDLKIVIGTSKSLADEFEERPLNKEDVLKAYLPIKE